MEVAVTVCIAPTDTALVKGTITKSSGLTLCDTLFLKSLKTVLTSLMPNPPGLPPTSLAIPSLSPLLTPPPC